MGELAPPANDQQSDGDPMKAMQDSMDKAKK